MRRRRRWARRSDALSLGKPALPPLPTICRAGRCRIETVEATDVAFVHLKGVLVRAYNQNWAYDQGRPAAATREADTVTFVFCSRSHPAVIEPIRAGEGAGKYALAFLAPEAQDFYNRANEPEIAEYFLVCHARRFDALGVDGPAFAKAAGYAAILGDAARNVEKPEDVFLFVNLRERGPLLHEVGNGGPKAKEGCGEQEASGVRWLRHSCNPLA